MYRSTWFRPASLQRLFILLSTTGFSRQLNTQTSTSFPAVSQNNKIAWFRNHALRLNDNEALLAAMKECDSQSVILPVFLWEKKNLDDRTGGTASDLFTAHTLKSLSLQLDGKLAIGTIVAKKQNFQSSTDINQTVNDIAWTLVKEIISICEKNNSDEIFYIRSNNVLLEERIAKHLVANGIKPRTFGGCSLLDYSKENVPWKDIILAHSWRSPLIPFVDFVLERLSAYDLQKPVETPLMKLNSLLGSVNSESINDFMDIDQLLQQLGTSSGGTVWGETIMESFPQNNEEAAMAELNTFLHALKPIQEGEKQTHFTSRLSPFLARGLLSPRQIYHELLNHDNDSDTASFVRRLCWRDYTHAVVSLFPDVLYGQPIRNGYNTNTDDLDNEQKHSLRMWKKGLTGFPLVDAAMRQLEKEGFMPQKCRLACSTCLVEGLNVPFQYGMQHFEEYLVDYDESINYNMWMNAGCVGLDPYYCGMKYRKRAYWDADGTYVRKWCPELKNLPDYISLDQGKGVKKKVDCLYEPWAAPRDILESAGVQLGKCYPFRVCDDRTNRQIFFEKMRKTRVEWPQDYIDDCKRDVVALGRQRDAERIGLFTPRAFQMKSRIKK